jgi:hypothetical protein
MSSNPTITINLNPVLEAYCRWVFESKTDEIVINRRHHVGKHIYSLVMPTDRPQPRPEKKHPVTFILPLTEYGKDELRTNYLSIHAWAEEKILDYIDSDFRLWVRNRFEIGYYKKCEQREIVEAILRGLNLRNNTDNFDMIKKIDYRNRRKKEEIRFEALLSYSV